MANSILDLTWTPVTRRRFWQRLRLLRSKNLCRDGQRRFIARRRTALLPLDISGIRHQCRPHYSAGPDARSAPYEPEPNPAVFGRHRPPEGNGKGHISRPGLGGTSAAAGKNKWGARGVSRPSPPKLDSSAMNEDEIRQAYELPSHEEYPKAPEFMLTDPRAAILSLGNESTRFLKLWSSTGNNVCCHLHCSTKAGTSPTDFVAAGRAPDRGTAEAAAFLMCLVKMHQRGLLKQFWGPDEDCFAKVDVYNYAARFDCVPVFTTTMEEESIQDPVSSAAQVTIELREQNITVTAQGSSLLAAETAASLLFKAEAEKFHVRHGGEAFRINDTTALTTYNAQAFVEYVKDLNAGSKVRIACNGVLVNREYIKGRIQVQVMLNDAPIGESVEMATKSQAEPLAYLTAAITLKKLDATLFPRFLQTVVNPQPVKGGEKRVVQRAMDLYIPADLTYSMRDTLYEVRKAGLSDTPPKTLSDEGTKVFSGSHSMLKRGTPDPEQRNRHLSNRLARYLSNPALDTLRRKREDLPVNRYREQVLSLIDNNPYSIIVGAAGSGKTTQVPQLLLERAIRQGAGVDCNIICTQPRRIAALSVARRVAMERNEVLEDTVGHHVRFDAKLPLWGGSITYCTTGILLQQLRHKPDETLDSISHLIVDEVHERDLPIDILLIMLKKIVGQRLREGKRAPRVVLMSATMDAELFANYFEQASETGNSIKCPSLLVPGRVFPVREVYLEDLLYTLQTSYPGMADRLRAESSTMDYLRLEEDYPKTLGHSAAPVEQRAMIDWNAEADDSPESELELSEERDVSVIPYQLISATIAHIARTTDEGAILVFLPGLDEIMNVAEELRRELYGVKFTNEAKYRITMLHSTLPAGQTEVFNPAPEGCRKIILATNIAETSVTIADVQHVVDTGKLRRLTYDPVTRVRKLQCAWISKANSKQRAGRAGRVQDGNYYALFSKARAMNLAQVGTPEMQESDLQAVCLAIKGQTFKASIREFLADAIEPPSSTAIDVAIRSLKALQALTENEELTPLGRILAWLPVHPIFGKMILLGIIFRCLDPMIILGSAASEQSIFLNPPLQKAEALKVRRSFEEQAGSDHIALLNAYRKLRDIRDEQGLQAAYEYANQNLLHFGIFKLILATSQQIELILVQAGLIPFTPISERPGSICGDATLNEHSSNVALIKALVLAGTYPNVAVRMNPKRYRTESLQGAVVHPSSVNELFDRGRKEQVTHPRHNLVTYSSSSRGLGGKSFFLRETSLVSPLMVTLFGGRVKNFAGDDVVVDGWIRFKARSSDPEAVKTIMEFRKALDRVLKQAFMEQKVGGKEESLARREVTRLFTDGLAEILGTDSRQQQISGP